MQSGAIRNKQTVSDHKITIYYSPKEYIDERSMMQKQCPLLTELNGIEQKCNGSKCALWKPWVDDRISDVNGNKLGYCRLPEVKLGNIIEKRKVA